MNVSTLPFQAFEAVASQPHTTPLWLGSTVVCVILAMATTSIYSRLKDSWPYPNFPMVSLPEEGLSPRQSWLLRAKEVITKGLEQHPHGFQVMQATGPRIILPNRYADEIKRIPDWSFVEFFRKEFFSSFPAFAPFDLPYHGQIMIDAVRVRLTQSLNAITEDLVDESNNYLRNTLGETKDWHSIKVKSFMSDLVAHLSARAFLGKKLAKNKEWIEMSKSYVINASTAMKELRKWHPFLRPIAYWFIPVVRTTHRQRLQATAIFKPEVERRKAAYDETVAAGKQPTKLYDSISWFLEMAKGRPVDVGTTQLSLAVGAILTTSELLSFAMIELCEHPELVEPLRQEITDVIGREGFQRTSLYKLRLMDSFMKETLRLHPTSWSLMRRHTGPRTVTLSDGQLIPPFASISVSTENMLDPARYPDPLRFDAYRFLRMRQERAGEENQHQFVSLSPDHLAFGYGDHACPGRFFAANEIKIALCHLLLKYDWSFPAGVTTRLPDHVSESQDSVNPDNELLVRRRQEEIAF